MSRRILRELRILELSAVDNPAQEGATYVLAKRADPGLTDSPVVEAKLNDDDNLGEDTMTDAEKAALAKAEADKATAETALAAEIAKGVQLAKVATLTDVEKDHYNGLVELDETGAAAFLEMSKDARTAEIKKATDADPVVYTDSEGHEYHKSEAKAAHLAKRADETAKENAVLKAAQADTAVEKRVTDLFKHLKGEMPAKIALLKSVEAIADEATRAAAIEMLKANDAGLGEAMKTLGTQAGLVKSAPEAKLNKMAEDLMATDKSLTFAKAFDTVAQTPEGVALYKEMYEATLPKAAA